jgi:serine/threonine-protein kinase
MVHRDIKPGNVMLTVADDGGDFVKLMDFGLVKATEDPQDDSSAITQHGAFLGTPQYVSPEQARGLPADARSDIYAVGVNMYRCLTGKLPYKADNLMAMALAHIREAYPPMAQRAPEVPIPEAIEAVVRRCMEKRPGDRYPDAGALLHDLRVARKLLDPEAEDPPTTEEATDSLLPVGAGWEGTTTDLGDRTTTATEVREPFAEARGPAGPGPEFSRPVRRWTWAVPALLAAAVGAGLWLWAAGGGMDAPSAQAVAPVARPERRVEPPPADRPLPTVVGAEVDAPVGPAPPRPEPAGGGESRPMEASRVPDVVDLAAPRTRATPEVSAPPPKAPAPVGPLVADGVPFTAGEAAGATAWLNMASDDDLKAAGITGAQLRAVLDNRPRPDIQAWAATYQVGARTLEKARSATAP